jgi:hypothetical protein
LKLISQNSSRTEFVLDVENVKRPDKILSEWVVRSYREGEAAGGDSKEGSEASEPGE